MNRSGAGFCRGDLDNALSLSTSVRRSEVRYGVIIKGYEARRVTVDMCRELRKFSFVRERRTEKSNGRKKLKRDGWVVGIWISTSNRISMTPNYLKV